MKHIYISVLCVVFISIYTVFSFFYIQNFTSEMEQRIKISELNGYSVSDIDEISEILLRKENILLFMMSKDHFDLLEEYAVNLRNAVEYEDEQNIKIYRTLFLKIIRDIEQPNKSPI